MQSRNRTLAPFLHPFSSPRDGKPQHWGSWGQISRWRGQTRNGGETAVAPIILLSFRSSNSSQTPWEFRDVHDG